jgi:hypothetical protein
MNLYKPPEVGNEQVKLPFNGLSQLNLSMLWLDQMQEYIHSARGWAL